MDGTERGHKNNPNNLLTTGDIEFSKRTQVSKALTRKQNPQAGKMGVHAPKINNQPEQQIYASKVNNEATDESPKPGRTAANLVDANVLGELK